MVFKNINEVKEKLNSIENIIFSKHAEEKMKNRKIDKKLIIENLKKPNMLEKFSFEPDKYPGEKYELYFSLTKRKVLKAIISLLDKDLNVVTVHIILSKRLKQVKKWQRKRK